MSEQRTEGRERRVVDVLTNGFECEVEALNCGHFQVRPHEASRESLTRECWQCAALPTPAGAP